MKSSAFNVYGTYTVATLNQEENFGLLHAWFKVIEVSCILVCHMHQDISSLG